MRRTVASVTFVVLGASTAVGDGVKDGTPVGESPRPARSVASPGDGHAYSPSGRTPRVGVLSGGDTAADHFCTASVIRSPGRNMLVTAAHCAYDSDHHRPRDLTFTPGYHDGDGPWGSWKVSSVVVDDRWAKDSDPDYDVAFLLLDAQHGTRIQDAVGGNTPGIDKGLTHAVKILGYPSDRDQPVACVNRTTKFSGTQMRIRCEGLSDGTSGSPWLIAGSSSGKQRDTVIGVTGGYHSGGEEDDVSYAVYFDRRLWALYEVALGKHT